ncbi:alanine racemase [bacterium (Candidatus Torokbacteria) CG09_land_8_20_14_0_10_42_11]|nr:MAG: alanine racemase [bacterium (Candidatus Torokbacteria) CG09_land_8_20_14_0_10_42_11]
MKKNLGKNFRTWLEIDTKAIKNNYQIFRNLIPKDCKFCGVVKSNAYGHGLADFAKELVKLGIDFLAVDSPVEGFHLRQEGIKIPILILGYTLPTMLKKVALNNLSITVSSLSNLQILPDLLGKKKIKIHLKLDTGMHRQGFYQDDLRKVLDFINKNKNIILEGSYTHFAAAKNPAFPQETKKQLASFQNWIKILIGKGYKPICHAAATAGAILYPDAHLNMVRVGIGLYGLWPSKEAKAFALERLKLKPVMQWKTIISEIKNVSKGEQIGYDFTESVDQNSKIAILPVGYWHGYPRSLSSIGHVLVGGKRCKILGRISMDMTIINISDVPGAKVSDAVCLLGKSGQEEISADDLAYLADTINYEIVTRINPLIKKMYS